MLHWFLAHTKKNSERQLGVSRRLWLCYGGSGFEFEQSITNVHLHARHDHIPNSVRSTFVAYLFSIGVHNTLFYFSHRAEATFPPIPVCQFRSVRQSPHLPATNPTYRSLVPHLMLSPLRLKRHGLWLHIGEHVFSRGSKVTQRMHSQVECR